MSPDPLDDLIEDLEKSMSRRTKPVSATDPTPAGYLALMRLMEEGNSRRERAERERCRTRSERGQVVNVTAVAGHGEA